jgi:hypothetical protein
LNLCLKTTDFGISIWKEDSEKENLSVTFYKAKDVYEVDDVKETLDFSFDIR